MRVRVEGTGAREKPRQRGMKSFKEDLRGKGLGVDRYIELKFHSVKKKTPI